VAATAGVSPSDRISGKSRWWTLVEYAASPVVTITRLSSLVIADASHR
jgi:hypothetical protein